MTALPREGERRCACGAVLARDNTGKLCGPCRRKRRDEAIAKASGPVSDEEILAMLAGGEWHTGEEVGIALGISRQCVGKHMASLRRAGHRIEGVPRRGYRLARKASAKRGVPPAPQAAGRAPKAPGGPPPFAGIDRHLDVFGECVRVIERSLADPVDRRRVAAALAAWFDGPYTVLEEV